MNYIFSHENNISFKKYLSVTSFHLFWVLEIFLLIWSLTIFIQDAAEVIVYNIFFYFWLISSIFVLWKLFRKKIKINNITNQAIILLCVLILWIAWEISYMFITDKLIYIYVYIIFLLLLSPIIVFIFKNIFFKSSTMKKIVILSWGPWLECEIAKKSAKLFKDHINKDFDYYELPKQLSNFLNNKDKYNLAIPVFHGEYWEDGKIFAFLDILGIPHTFSDYSTHCLCLDKEKTNALVFQLWVKVPFQYIAETSESFPESYPIIMKPNHWGSSFHTYKVTNHQEFYDCFNKTRHDLSDKILIQEFVIWEEYSVPVVNREILPIMKLEKADDEVFDYEAKYEENQEIKEIFPKIQTKLLEKLKSDTLKVYDYFHLKWMSRIDFLVREGEVYFLEINTIPWMTEASILPKAWKLTNRSLEELVKEITII